MRTLILGIGNTILGDDGIGVLAAREVASRIDDDNADVSDASFDGLNLLDLVIGYDKLVVIDAIAADPEKIGQVFRLKPGDICQPSHFLPAPHHSNLITTIETGKRLFPKDMPREVIVFAVGIGEVNEVGEEMTGTVKEAVPKVVNLVLEEIKQPGLQPSRGN